ncbi:MAG: hypothetical protein WCQ67_03145 [Treponema sp.]
MNFVFTLSAAVVCFAVGISLGSFASMAVSKALHHKQKSYRLSLSLVMLSLAVAVAALAIIVISQNTTRSFFDFTNYISFTKTNIIYCSAIFTLGVLCGVIPIIFFPAAIVIYVAASIFTTVQVYKTFGLQTDIVPVTVSENKIQVDKKTYNINSLPNQQNEILFTVYTLPDYLIVPLPRTWYLQTSVQKSAEQESPLLSTESAVTAAKVSSQESNTSSKKSSFINNYIFSNTKTKTVKLPPSKFYPAIYTVTATRYITELNFTASRSF